MSEKDFFIESAFGEVYAGTFFAEDFPQPQNQRKNTSKEKTIEEVKFDEATSKVRMSTEAEVKHQVTEKFNSMYGLGNLGGVGGMYSTFNGNIF